MPPRPRRRAAPLGALAARRKPLQDSPTPAGNPTAASALLRLEALSGRAEYREIAEDTLGLLCRHRGALRPLRRQLRAGAGAAAARSGAGGGGGFRPRGRAPGGTGRGALRRQQDGDAHRTVPAGSQGGFPRRWPKRCFRFPSRPEPRCGRWCAAGAPACRPSPMPRRWWKLWKTSFEGRNFRIIFSESPVRLRFSTPRRIVTIWVGATTSPQLRRQLFEE